ncbi:UDP-galactopyranose mutase [Chthonobacter rhizosphaerae]|uniref:UDP-galactopyranose mutase n=1 Tax=Chthonobacter rhizosphaerae TaxID=2735553 RepID=UPI0015EEBFC8|nr:UDP-galactopyranose mutase [Chthonobacter rhizosphaerae]
MGSDWAYDYVIVGAGMFGATFARLATDAGRRCLVVDRRPHIGGNCYTEEVEGITVHRYGAHIFHTSDDWIWSFVNRFVRFNNFVNAPMAYADGRLYSLPFSMHTFNQLWGVTRPDEAAAIIDGQRLRLDRDPANLEEQALSLVGTDIYRLLIQGYTRKQWMREPRDLPAWIIKRLPLRFTYNNNYFADRYQGIPETGYTSLFDALLDGVEVRLGVDFLAHRADLRSLGRTLVFTGRIDEYFGFEHGELEYRTLRFDTQVLQTPNFQGNAVINYCDADVPYTRIIEHKHFAFGQQPATVVTYEYPEPWSRSAVPYYPVNDAENTRRFKLYQERGRDEPGVLFGGRLAEYRYYDMHQVIGSARAAFERHTRGPGWRTDDAGGR